jgi:hypothetical protein
MPGRTLLALACLRRSAGGGGGDPKPYAGPPPPPAAPAPRTGIHLPVTASSRGRRTAHFRDKFRGSSRVVNPRTVAEAGTSRRYPPRRPSGQRGPPRGGHGPGPAQPGPRYPPPIHPSRPEHHHARHHPITAVPPAWPAGLLPDPARQGAREEPADPVKSRCPVTMSTAHHANSVPYPLEDPMTTHTCTRRPSAPAYYLGRPASFWLAALAPPQASGGEFR